jgi:hemolysin activation/secretion protein
VTLGANNTGDPAEGGEARVLAYLQYANLFNMDQTLGFAYTTAPSDSSGVKQYGLYYKAPIYFLGGVVSASHSYSTTSSGALGSGQVITGAGTIDGIAYTQLFSPIGAYKSSVALGLDDKLFRAPTIGTAELTGGDVRSTPISLAYTANYEGSWGTNNFSIEVDHNLTAGSHNDDESYNANRVGASNDWNALRVNYTLGVPLYRGFALNVRVVGQYSSDALIQGEEFGLGGASSVRGAEERAVIGDSGASSTFEIYTPNLGQNVRLLAFSDNGFVTRHDPVIGQSSRDQLQSVGVGLRWTYLQFAQFAIDYGYITKGSQYPTIPSGTQRIHANLLYTFN